MTQNTEEFILVGISLGRKTTNENGQSAIDCGGLWTRFEKEQVASKIKNKTDESVIAVYHNYEGNHEDPFDYFIGCKVNAAEELEEGLETLKIKAGKFSKYTAKGKLPDCIASAWQRIWNSESSRAYHQDFEVYDERSHNWEDGEVDIYISVL